MSDIVPDFGKPEPVAREPVSLRSFFLLALLWLPGAFFVWFALRSPISRITIELAHWMFNWWQPGIIHSEKLRSHIWSVNALVPPPPGIEVQAGQLPAIAVDVNVLLYTYGLAVFWGLTFATPTEEFSLARKIRDGFIGWLCLLPLHAFGVVMHIAMNVFVALGDVSTKYAAEKGVSPEFVAYFYQFSTLVMPTLSGLIAWAILHRHFLRDLQGDHWLGQETKSQPAGQKPGPEGET